MEHILMYELSGDFTNKYFNYRENPKIGNYPSSACPYVKQYTLVGWAVSYFRVFSVLGPY
jgi:hypothetical protein